MISTGAGKALGLVSGLELVMEEDSADLWRQLVIRIILDLDESGNNAQIDSIRQFLAEKWQRCHDTENHDEIMRLREVNSSQLAVLRRVRSLAQLWSMAASGGSMTTASREILDILDGHERPPAAPGHAAAPE